MTIVNSLIEKATSRLNSALFLNSSKEKKEYIKISLLSFLAFSGGFYTLINVSHMGLRIAAAPFFLLGTFCLMVSIPLFFQSYYKCKMVIKNDTKSLADEHSQEELTNEEVNELFSLQLPDYILQDLYSNIKYGGNLYYVQLLKINKMLELGQEHYEEKQAKEETRISEGVNNFIQKHQLSEQNIKTANRILQLNNKVKQHTKTFNSKKVL